MKVLPYISFICSHAKNRFLFISSLLPFPYVQGQTGCLLPYGAVDVELDVSRCGALEQLWTRLQLPTRLTDDYALTLIFHF
jgi:hypothetical protein